MLAKLSPAFRQHGTTAGNAPGLNSGAAATVVAARELAARKGLQPIAGHGVAPVEPGMFGIGPVPAFRRALERAHWNLHDVERVERRSRPCPWRCCANWGTTGRNGSRHPAHC